MRTVGLVGWAVVFALVLVWEGFGLLHPHDDWPTISDMLRRVTRATAGRYALFGAWIWVGWHLFLRGFRFFMGSPR